MPSGDDRPELPSAGFLDIESNRLEYRCAGRLAAQGRVVVLLHEGLGSALLWGTFPENLARVSGLPVFAYSRAGYGGSSPVALPRRPDFLEREALDVLPRVLDAIGAGPCVLVGHSDGATIAALSASAGDTRIRGAALIAPHVFVEDVTLAGLIRARAAFQEGTLRRKLARHHDDVEGAFRGWNETWLDPARRHWDVRAELSRIRIPIAVIQGDRDNFGTRAQLEAVGRACPHAEFHLLVGIGHAPHAEDAEGTLVILSAFADRVMTASRGVCSASTVMN